MRYYSDLLPSYLDGENIRGHSGVIERSDKYVDGLVELFGLWDKLERPILIKREQLGGNGVNTVSLYVNTPSPIKEIIIEGDIEETIIPTDTVTTTYEGTWTIENPSIEICNVHGMRVRMPLVTVTVMTETHTYTKTYPENDTMQNDNADHDVFLDIVGGLLGIPRRKYSTVKILSTLLRTLSDTVPPYMAKEVQTVSNGIIILPCSEDDYYYYERLQYFIQSKGDILRVFHTIYDKDAVILKKEDNIIPSELVGTETIAIFTYIQKGVDGNKTNIDITNIQQIAEQSLPVTRRVQIYPHAAIVKYDSTTQEQYVNRYKLHLTLGLSAKTIYQSLPSQNVPIANLPVNITYDDGTELGTFTTNENGIAHISIDGARSGQQTLKWDLTREYPYFGVIGSRNISYNASLFKLSLDDDAWQYKKFRGTSVTSFEEPTILQNENLNCGRGYLTYTPAINPAIVNISTYTMTIQFHYTNSNQTLRLGSLVTYDDDTATINGIITTPRNYDTVNPDISDTHYLKYKFLDGICYVYYDDTYTGQSFDFNNTTDMIYLAGFNYRANSDPATAGLHIHGVSVADSVDIDTPPN